MKFLPWLKQDYQPNFHLLHFACYRYSAVACLSWKSPGYLVGQRRGVEDAKSTATCSLIMTNYNKWKIEGSWTYLEGHTSTFFLWWREVTCVAWYSPSPGWTPPLQATRRSPGYKGPVPLRQKLPGLGIALTSVALRPSCPNGRAVLTVELSKRSSCPTDELSEHPTMQRTEECNQG
jgi:hypothetical protein